MRRVRAGQDQLFREEPYPARDFVTTETADVVLRHESQSVYADLVDGVWMWVQGCNQCNGLPRYGHAYLGDCEEHDVCVTCGIHRSELAESPWGGRDGWECKPCATAAHEREKAAALAAMPEIHEPWEYRGNDDARCPYCNAEIDTSDLHDAVDQEMSIECHRCDHTFALNGSVSITWSTHRIPQDGGEV